MKQVKSTIKQVAKVAGVSIATVSHVINRTRYVKPELVEKVERAIVETGYQEKIVGKTGGLRIGKSSIVAAVFPGIDSPVYRKMIGFLRQMTAKEGYQLQVSVSNDDLKEEKSILENLIMDKRNVGLILMPVSDDAKDYEKLLRSKLPCICVGRSIAKSELESVKFKDRAAIYKGTKYLMECGHNHLLFLREKRESSSGIESTKGYMQALSESRMNAGRGEIAEIDLYRTGAENELQIQKIISEMRPTAVITNGNRLTFLLVKAIRDMGLECPEDISVVGYGDDDWCELTVPPLTTLERDIEGLSRLAVELLWEKLEKRKTLSIERLAKVELKIRESTRMLDNGPFGEEAVKPEDIVITQQEKEALRAGKYRVAISFHYTGTAWASLHVGA